MKTSEELRMELARAYMATFAGPEGQAVLEDLKAQYQDRSPLPSDITADVNLNGMLVHEGGRRVYLYIAGKVEEGRKYAGGNPATAIIHDERDADSDPDGESKPVFRFES